MCQRGVLYFVWCMGMLVQIIGYAVAILLLLYIAVELCWGGKRGL